MSSEPCGIKALFSHYLRLEQLYASDEPVCCVELMPLADAGVAETALDLSQRPKVYVQCIGGQFLVGETAHSMAPCNLNNMGCPACEAPMADYSVSACGIVFAYGSVPLLPVHYLKYASATTVLTSCNRTCQACVWQDYRCDCLVEPCCAAHVDE